MIKALLNLFKPKQKVSFTEYENTEWAFQFNEDEPVLLAIPAKNTKKLIIQINSKKDSNVIFKDGKGNEFKIFARERIENFTFDKK